jgi:hypothetical protein
MAHLCARDAGSQYGRIKEEITAPMSHSIEPNIEIADLTPRTLSCRGRGLRGKRMILARTAAKMNFRCHPLCHLMPCYALDNQSKSRRHILVCFIPHALRQEMTSHILSGSVQLVTVQESQCALLRPHHYAEGHISYHLSFWDGNLDRNVMFHGMFVV